MQLFKSPPNLSLDRAFKIPAPQHRTQASGFRDNRHAIPSIISHQRGEAKRIDHRSTHGPWNQTKENQSSNQMIIFGTHLECRYRGCTSYERYMEWILTM
jgi:hypothetical protein